MSVDAPSRPAPVTTLLPTLLPTPQPVAPSSTPTPVAGAPGGIFILSGGDRATEDGTVDRDGDGLPDAVDPFPDLPAEREGTTALMLTSVASEVEGGSALHKAHAERPLALQVAGAPSQETLYAVLWSAEGPRVESLTQHGDRVWLPAEALAAPFDRISVATAESQSRALPVRWYPVGAPMLVDPPETAVGGTLELRGLNLDVVTAASVGGIALSVQDRQAGRLRLGVPEAARGGSLTLSGVAGIVETAPLPLSRSLGLTVDPDLHAAVPALSWQVGERLLTAATDVAFSRRIPADPQPQLVAFEPDPRRLLRVQVFVGPGETVVHLDAARVLEGLAAPAWQQAQAATARQGEAGLAVLREVLAGGEGQALAAELRDALRDDDLDRFVARLPALRGLAARAALERPAPVSAKVGLRVRDLATGTYRIRRGNVVDEGRNELSNFSVVNTDPSLGFADRCQGLLAGGAPPGFAPFDLCLENDNVVPASVAVTLEGQRRPARSHINPAVGLFDPNIAGGNTLGLLFRSQNTFLTADNMQPLCGQASCRIDVLTGGAGVGLRENLSPREREVAELLQRRAFLDLVLLPLISTTVGLGGSLNNQQCLATGIDKTIASGVIVRDFVAKLEAAAPLDGDKVSSLAQDFLRQPVIDLLLNLEGVIADCGFAALPTVKAVKDKIQETIDKRLSTASRFAGAITAAVQIGVTGVEFATTPRKISFEYQPLARVTSLTETFDVSRPDPPPLVIRGPQLAETDPEAPSQFLPTLVFTGPRKSNGAPRIETLEVQPGWVSIDAGTGQELDNRRRISVPAAILAFRFQRDFRVGPIRLVLRYQHPDLSEFPGGMIEIPAGTFRFVTAPEVLNIDPLVVPVGEPVRIRGYRLDTLSAALARGEVTVELNPTDFAANQPSLLISQNLRLVELPGVEADQGTALEFLAPELDGDALRSYEVELSSPTLSGIFGPIVVSGSAETGSVSIVDSGSCKDDSARVELFEDIDPEIEFFVAELVTDEASGYAGGILWNNDSPDFDTIATAQVTCLSAGDDCVGSRAGRQDPPGICTFSVQIVRPGRPSTTSVRLNLSAGETMRFDVRP